MKSVFSCGFGVQSTTLLGMMCYGDIPKSDFSVFSDPGAESEETYAHIAWCLELGAKHGIKIDMVSAGNIWHDAISFAERKENAGTLRYAPVRSGTLRYAPVRSGTLRYASIPLFVLNNNGSQGMMPRQCTKEYKLEPIEEYHRRVVLELKPRQRAPKDPTVDVWIGISADEERRATPPGRWRTLTVEAGKDLFDEPITKNEKKWEPVPWQIKTFPLMGYSLYPDRSKVKREEFDACAGFDRDDCVNWLEKAYPDHKVPRSACVFCPYRTNKEWLEIKTNHPTEFARAVEFDERIRLAYSEGQRQRGHLAGVPYIHRTLVPLAQVDLTEPLNDRKGCGGLFSEEPDGICGV